MKSVDDYLSPHFAAPFLDLYLTRSAILRALKKNLADFSGTLLDIGCGFMPYRSVVFSPPSRVQKYIGMDLAENIYQKPDLEWDGQTIPLDNDSVDCALATEVFEHCPEPHAVMGEACRVLRPGGTLFFTVPFLWPLHDVPHDEYRFTPFALERHLRNAGFTGISMQAQGGWDASLAQMIGLWVRRRPFSPFKRAVLSRIAFPVVRYLVRKDDIPVRFDEGTMITGLTGTARKDFLG
jgi:SAM-dependent methyltransferase